MKCLLFDYGGTLDADGITWLERFRPIYKEAGVEAAPERLERAFYDAEDRLAERHRLPGLDLAETVRLQVADTLAALAPERAALAEPIARRFTDDCRRQLARVRPVLERLSARYRLGVISNFYGNLDGILAAEGLRGLFSVVADSGALGVIKPDPAIFRHAASAAGAEPADCLMVGDSVKRDIAGAAGVGMRKALVARGAAPQAGQDWTIGSVVELEGLLS